MEHLRTGLAGLDLQETEEDGDVFDSVFQPPLSQPAEDDAAEEAASDYSPDDMTCAICLERTPLTDIALVKGCEHQYCVHCILQWAMCKEWCPQCKKPFDYLLTHRQLDGTLTDYLNEESVVLLKRARWFDDHMREKEKGKAAMPILPPGASGSSSTAYAAADADHPDHELRSWEDFYEDYVDAELEEDEEIEQYYFSSAAGRARVVLGNRRWGEGGYMRAGRMYARPVQHTARTPNAAGGKTAGKSTGKSAAAAKAPAGSSPGAGSSRAAAAAAANGAGGSSAAGCSSAAAAGSNRSGGAGCSSSSRAIDGGASSSRGRSGGGAAASSSSAVAGWLDGDDDDDDEYGYGYDSYEGEYPRLGGGAGSSSGGNRRGSSGSRSRSRPDRPAGMVKPIRQMPKNLAQSPVCSMAAGPLVSPLGKSPGGGGFAVGSWGTSSSSGGAGSTPGSGRRAKRNARRAAADGGGGGGGEWD